MKPSNFMVVLDIELKEGPSIGWHSPWYCCEDNGEIHVKKSPKEMGQCENIDQLISMIFHAISANGHPALDENSTAIKRLRGLSSMSEIKSISIFGSEHYGRFDCRDRRFKYELDSKVYKMKHCGEEMESAGMGGDLHIRDYKQAMVDADSDIECVVNISIISKNGEKSSVKLTGSNSSVKDDWNDYKSFAISYIPEELEKCQSLDELKMLLDEMTFAERKPVSLSQNLICSHPSIHTIEDVSSLIIEVDQRLYFDWYVSGNETYEYSFEKHTSTKKQSGIKFEQKEDSLVKIYERKLEFSDFEIKDGILEKYHGTDKHVKIPEGVTSIGKNAFNECLSLESVIISNSVTSIGESAFSWCRNLVNIEIPDSVTEISRYAFNQCSNLINIDIPDSVTELHNGVFSDCRKLVSIVFPKNIQFIGSYTFSGCESLREIIIPSSITNIYDGAFADCNNLEKVILPEGLKSISSSWGSGAFENCKKLKEIKIPSSVVEMDHLAFRGCSKSLKIEFAENTYLNMGLKPMQEFIFKSKYWSKLAEDTQAELFMKNQGKTLFSLYQEQTSSDQAEKLGENILRILLEKPTQKNCNAVANFMIMFAEVVSAELLLKLYEAIKGAESGKKALGMIENDVRIKKVIEGAIRNT